MRFPCHVCPLRAGGRCTVSGREIAAHLADWTCPKGHFPLASAPTPDVPVAALQDARFRSLWVELHTGALANGITDEWLERFAWRVPCGECRGHWLALVAADPLPTAGQFEWSCRAHDAVNRRLGKPEMGGDEARAVWVKSV